MAELRTGFCPKCEHDAVLHIKQVADRLGESGGGRITHGTDHRPEPGQFVPWRIARIPNPHGSVWTSHVRAVGLVEAYVCQACGFTELFTQQPELIPIDGDHVVLIKGSKGPFR